MYSQTVPDVRQLDLNGQDIEVASRFVSLSSIEQYLKVYLDPELNGLLLIDEFQYIQGVSTMLKLLTDKYSGLKVLCSGSSSLDILQRIDESLAGRVRVIEVLSLSFEEYLMFRDEKLYKLYSAIGTEGKPTKDLLSAYDEYLIYGGFPRAALTDNPEEKAEILNDIYRTYLLNDVRRYVANEHFTAFGRLIRLLAAQIGGLVNISELSRTSGLPYETCEKYIYLLQKMYIIRLIEPYSTNHRKMIGKMKKVYFCDLGLRNIVYNSFNEMAFRSDAGAIFENEVMLELWRGKKASEALYFYRTQNGVEVDFILDGPTRRIAIECKYKHIERPSSIPSLNNIGEEEGINTRLVADIDFSGESNGLHYCPGMYIGTVV